MLFPKVRDPFFRMCLYAFVAALFGMIGGFIVGLLLAAIGGKVTMDQVTGTMVLARAVSTMGLGAMLGTLLGGVYGLIPRHQCMDCEWDMDDEPVVVEEVVATTSNEPGQI